MHGSKPPESWLKLVLILFLCSAASAATAQEPKITGYVLTKVLTGQERTGAEKRPSELWADASGGRVVIEIAHRDGCLEKTTFAWEFDRDIRFLPLNEEFTVTTTVGVSGDCERNPFSIAGGISDVFRSRLSPEEAGARRVTLVSLPNLEGERRIHGKAGPPRAGAGSDRFALSDERPYLAFGMNLSATSRWEGYEGRIAYIFRAVYSDTPPEDVPIEMDNPRPESATSSPIPPAGTPPDTPPDTPAGSPPGTPAGTPPGGGDPCLDPDVQRCIDQWLEQWVALLNRIRPDQAPWSISRYGHLVNRQTVSVQAPDEWETTYQASKYCYVWIRYSEVHLEAVYGGQLPPLRDFVANCSGQPVGGSGTGAPPGGPGTGTPPGGPATGPGGGGGPLPPGGAQGRTLLADRRTVRAGQRVLVPVSLLRPDGVANMNFTVTYEAGVAVPDGTVVKGSLLSGTRLESNSTGAGVIRIGFAQASGLSSDGIVANLPFRAVGAAGQRTPLALAVTDIDDPGGNALSIQLIDGEIIIQGPGQGTPGDCDGDGRLTIADALCALKMSVGLMPVDMNLDVNGDGQVTSGDAREIIQRMP